MPVTGTPAAETPDTGTPVAGARSAPTVRYAGIGDEAGDALDIQLDAVATLGWRELELRTVDGVPVASLDDAAFDVVVTTIAERGVRVPCVASGIGGWARPVDGDFGRDLAELDRLAGCCRALGTRYVRVMSYPNAGLDDGAWRARVLDRLRVLADRAGTAGLVLLHENCAGWAGSDPARMLDLVCTVDSPALRLLFDTGNGAAYGYRPYPMLAGIVDHVAHVHVKDAAAGDAGPRYTLLGAGDARLADCLRLLLANGFAGTWSIEPHVAFRPHERVAEPDRCSRFVAYGRAFEALVRAAVLPAAAGWSSVAGGLSDEERR